MATVAPPQPSEKHCAPGIWLREQRREGTGPTRCEESRTAEEADRRGSAVPRLRPLEFGQRGQAPARLAARAGRADRHGGLCRPAGARTARARAGDRPGDRPQRRLRLLPRFETITYRELWARARAVASEWHHHGQHPLTAGDFVCILGFTSPDYATRAVGRHPPRRGQRAAADQRAAGPARRHHRRDRAAHPGREHRLSRRRGRCRARRHRAATPGRLRL